MNTEKLSKLIERGSCEVEHLIAMALKDQELSISGLIELSDKLRLNENNIKATGSNAIPFSKWVMAMAWYKDGGYEKLFLMAREKISYYPFALAFCEQDKEGGARYALYNEIRKSKLSDRNNRSLIWAINIVFLKVNPLNECQQGWFRDFLHEQLNSQNDETVYAAICALRAFFNPQSILLAEKRMPLRNRNHDAQLVIKQLKKKMQEVQL